MTNPQPDPVSSDGDSIDKFAQSYVDLFGSMPAMPGARFKLLGDLDKELLLGFEKLRAKALYSDVFDDKFTQLILFGMLLVEGHPAAQHHARAARKHGASWEELLKILELASVTGYLHSANQGSALLQAMRDEAA